LREKISFRISAEYALRDVYKLISIPEFELTHFLTETSKSNLLTIEMS